MGWIYPGAQCTTEIPFAQGALHAILTPVYVRAPAWPARLGIEGDPAAGGHEPHQVLLGIRAATAHARAHGPRYRGPGAGMTGSTELSMGGHSLRCVLRFPIRLDGFGV